MGNSGSRRIGRLLVGVLVGSAALQWGALPPRAEAPADKPGLATQAPAAERAPQDKPGEKAEGAQPTAAALGPALENPKELLDVLEQRKRALDRREEAVRASEGRLATLKSEIEQLLARAEKARQATEQADAEGRKVSLTHIAKMYETMPAEEAAARIEKMPTKTAIEVLHQLKGKTAGAILSLVRPEVAAKLTERYMAVPVKTPKIGN